MEEVTRFPQDPNRRRALLLLNQASYERMKYEPRDAQLLYDDESHVLKLPFEVSEELPVALQNIADSGLARPGLILVQSPFDPDTYEDASIAPHEFALAKHLHFSALCRHLGAKSVRVEHVDHKSRSVEDELSMKGGRPFVANGEIEAQREEIEKVKRQLHLHNEFSGGRPDVEAAERLLRVKGLWSDQIMRSLIEHRRDGENRLSLMKFVLGLSSESTNNLRIVGRISVPAYVDLSADYRRVSKQQHEYTVTVAVQF